MADDFHCNGRRLFFAPIGIWHLCVKTHEDHDATTKTLEKD